MTQSSDDLRAAGHAALARHAWREAFDNLTAAQASEPDDLAALGEAAWWLSRVDDAIVARERAYAGYLQANQRGQAALIALELTRDSFQRSNSTLGMAWFKRADQLLDGMSESVEHGYLARVRCVIAFEGAHDSDTALVQAERVLDIGARFGDRDLTALGLHDKGRILAAKGQVNEGMALLDEATVPAMAGELNPMTTGIVYCNVISICEALADFRRAVDWSDAARRWCERQAVSGFPGICRVYRATIMRFLGAWNEAEREARQALEELRSFHVGYAAAALHEIGEVRLRLGDIAGAEEAFRQAHELGRDPQPGLALLRVAQGKPDAALASIRTALEERPDDRLERARLLPAFVEVALAAGDLPAAHAAADELKAIAQAYETATLQAAAAGARGYVELLEGNPESRRSLRRACQLWTAVEAPYEAGRVRMLLGAAYRAGGDEDAALLELGAAKTTFERLGATIDLRRATQLLEGSRGPGSIEVRLQRTLMFTDIVRSSDLVEAIGDEAWADLLRWHDNALRSLFTAHRGEEIDHAGDGFFVAFEHPAEALACAVAIQRAFTDHRQRHGFAPHLRIGLHATKAARGGRSFRGRGVHQAARIASQAGAGEILASSDTVAGAGGVVKASEPRLVRLKGFRDPVGVVTIHWR